ncbi:MAG TPA: universal stress protein, partial [Burkholderiaceae bacterium]|nr:universal stress protein [Burkholderiaceae bacterium]
PLLIVKNEPKQLYRHILVPVDFSEDSKRAAEFALEVAPKADVTFLHAFEVWFEGQMQYAGVSRELIDDYRLKAREEARLKLNQFITGLNAEERYLNRVVTFGIPGPVVREYAKQMQPDLIVMGKHGRSRFAELIIGSVTRDTIDQTDADLLVVPASVAGPA